MRDFKNRKIKICHVLSSADIAGGERYLKDLINNTKATLHNIVILPYSGKFCIVLKQLGVTYFIVDMKRKTSFRPALKIATIIKEYDIGIVHTHGYRANFYGRLAAIFTRVKCVSTVHVSLFDYIDTPRPLRWVYIALEKLLSFKTSRYLCVSGAMQKDIIKMGINARKTSLIPNGVDTHTFSPRVADRTKLDQYGLIDLGGPIIGTVGRLVNEKGHQYLLEAMVRLAGKWKDLKCLFIGEGPQLKKLEAQVEYLGLKENCKFIGTIRDIENLYPMLDVFVLPSPKEPFGLALLEAMATQIPVIAANAGGPAEFIESGENGLLFKPGDSEDLAKQISKLLSDNTLAQKLAFNGYHTAIYKYDIRQTTTQITHEYNRLGNVS